MQLSDRGSSFPTTLAGIVERGSQAGQFPGSDSILCPRGTPDFIDYGELSPTLMSKTVIEWSTGTLKKQ